MTQILPATSPKAIRLARRLLRESEVIALPTDTLYGFGVLTNNDAAIARIYEIKKREKNKPFSIMVNDREQAEEIVGSMSEQERRMFDLLLPGKTNLIVRFISYTQLAAIKPQRTRRTITWII